MKIVLIGFMGSGKSTISKLLKSEMKLPLFDTDQMIESESKMKIKDIFALHGEIYFREMEMRICKELGSVESGIISTGGGVVVNRINLESLRENGGQIVSLYSDFETISKRVLMQSDVVRPLFQNIKNANRLFQERAPLYKAYSDMEVDTRNKSASEIVSEIINMMDNLLEKNCHPECRLKSSILASAEPAEVNG